MKRTAYVLIVLGFLAFFSAGCKKPESDADGIRAGINQHLSSLKTLNLGAMDMNIKNVSVQGNQAQAQVEFTPKGGSPSGGGMQVDYALEKQNGVWVVQNTQPVGTPAQHPGPDGDNAQPNPAPSSQDSMPNFRDLVPGGATSNSLPPGHPPVQ